MSAAIERLIAEERLPPAYAGVVERFWRPLAGFIAAKAAARRPLVVGINGAQGSGKSTLCRFLELLLAERGLAAVTLALDDLYLGRAERAALAADVHALFATRGVPGTHDVALGMEIIARLRSGRPFTLPAFDKASDDRAGPGTPVTQPVDVLLVEGWCIGAPPQDEAELAAPVNRLEAEEDADLRWRRAVNARLAGDYACFFAALDLLIMLKVESFDAVLANRRLQEQKLAAARPGAPGLMDEAALQRFIAHYERLTRHQLARLPALADMVFAIGPDQVPQALPAPLVAVDLDAPSR